MYCSNIYKKHGWNWERCSLQIRNANSVSIPTPIAPNVWILNSAPTALLTEIMLICPEVAPRFIKTQSPIHILWLPPACSATSQHFHLPPHYETQEVTVNISLNTANLNIMNISPLEFRIWLHLEVHWNGTQLYHMTNIRSLPIDELYKHMVSSNGPFTPFMSADESTGDTASIWTLFSRLHNSYRISHTCRIRDILLLLFLVLTCQISTLTFIIMFYMTYYCGWWCRGSTHLQMQWQGWTGSIKTSWESWPV